MAETHVPAPAGARLDFTWTSSNSIAVTPTQGGEETLSSQVRWGGLSSKRRRLAQDTQPLFERTRAGDSSTRQQAVHQTVECLSSCGGLKAEAERLILDLAQTLVQASLPGTTLAQVLRAWLRTHHATLLRTMQQQPSLLDRLQAFSAEQLEEDPSFWQLLSQAAAIGWTSEAADLLQQHSAWRHLHRTQTDHNLVALVSVLEATDTLLRRMPHGPSQEGRVPRQAWQAGVESTLQDAALWPAVRAAHAGTAKGLQSLLELLAGSPDRLIDSTQTWLDLAVGMLVLIYPQVQLRGDMGVLMSQALSQRSGDSLGDLGTACQGMLQAAAEGNAHGIVASASAVLSDWGMTVLCAIMAQHPHGSGLLETQIPHLGCSLEESVLLQYASVLASEASTQLLALSYLQACPRHGGQAAQAVLRQAGSCTGSSGTPDESAAESAIAAANRLGLADHGSKQKSAAGTAAEICQAVGSALVAAQHWPKALQWLDRGGDAGLVLRAAQLALEHVHVLDNVQELHAVVKELGGSVRSQGHPSSDLRGLDTLLAACELRMGLQSFNAALPGSQEAARAGKQAAAASLALLGAPEGSCHEAAQLQAVYQCIPAMARPGCRLSSSQSYQAVIDLQRLEQRVAAAGGGSEAELQAVRLAIAQSLANAHVQEITA